jgi:hypothetical protein
MQRLKNKFNSQSHLVLEDEEREPKRSSLTSVWSVALGGRSGKCEMNVEFKVPEVAAEHRGWAQNQEFHRHEPREGVQNKINLLIDYHQFLHGIIKTNASSLNHTRLGASRSSKCRSSSI